MELLRQHPGRRKSNFDQCSTTDFAGYAKAGMVGLDQGLDDRQAKAGAAGTPVRHGGDLTKRFKGRFQILLAHPAAGVAYAQHHLLIIGQRRRYDDLAPCTREFDGIGQQVQRDLTN